MDKIKFVLEHFGERGTILAPPATEEQIERCNKRLRLNKLQELPVDYAHFLQHFCNGYYTDWGGGAFYGTETIVKDPAAMIEVQRMQKDIMSRNVDAMEYSRQGERLDAERLLIGIGHKTRYCYNAEKAVYEVREEFAPYDLLTTYGDFVELFVSEIGRFFNIIFR